LRAAPGVDGHARRVVGPAVHHHQRGDLEVPDQGGHGLQDVADVLFLLVGGDHRHHRAELHPRVPLLEIGLGVIEGEPAQVGGPLALAGLGQGQPAMPLGGRH
jgi:hypothetical protein